MYFNFQTNPSAKLAMRVVSLAGNEQYLLIDLKRVQNKTSIYLKNRTHLVGSHSWNHFRLHSTSKTP